MIPTRSSTARDIARELIDQEVAGADEPAAVGAALQRVWTRMAENLRRAVGDDGYNALLARALTRTQTEHPVLLDIRRVGKSDIYLDGVAESVTTRGAAPVRAAIEAILAAIADVLTGLIGADMVLNLLTDRRSQDAVISQRQGQGQ